MDWFTVGFLAIFLSVFVLTVVAERILIPILQTKKMGQKILDIGPRWHKSKEGTPTMGGIAFILSTLLVMAVFFIVKGVQGTSAKYIPLALTLIYAVSNGAVGFVDDYFKLVIKKENEGLTAKQKLILQLVLSAAYVCVMRYTGCMETTLVLPFAKQAVELGWWYIAIKGLSVLAEMIAVTIVFILWLCLSPRTSRSSFGISSIESTPALHASSIS